MADKEDKIPEFEIEEEGAPAVEIIDDTPPEDQGRAPLPKELVDELEADELEEYSDKVKQRLKQMKKVWHDERREKERLAREHQEAVNVARKVYEENKRLRETLSTGEKTLVDSYRASADLEPMKAAMPISSWRRRRSCRRPRSALSS
jgi:hypothetical protein